MAYSSIAVFVEIAASAVAVSIVCTSDGKTSAVVSAELAVKIPVRKIFQLHKAVCRQLSKPCLGVLGINQIRKADIQSV